MRLDERFHIGKDAYNVILHYSEKKTATTGKSSGKEVVSTNKWFYPNLSGALKKYLDIVIEENMEASEDVSQLIHRLDGIEALVDEIIDKTSS